MVNTEDKGKRDCNVDWMTLHVICDSENTVGSELQVRDELSPVGTDVRREPSAFVQAGADVHTVHEHRQSAGRMSITQHNYAFRRLGLSRHR